MAQSTVKHPVEDVVDLSEEAPIRVLHVDDEAGFLKAAKPCLEMQGAFHVDTASSVEEAYEKMREKSYDAIICDYIMPGKDGLEFLKELRDSRNDIPFIIFTGKGREIVAIKALNLGADQYVNKIGSPEVVYSELAHGIRKVMKTKAAEEALRRSEERYRSLFLNMLDGFAYCKIILDEKNKPIDFVYLEVNDAFEKLTGLKREDVIGRKVTEAIPGTKEAHPELFDIYGRVALTGKEEQFDIHFKPLDIWLSIAVYSPKKGYFVAIFENITERKKTDEALRKSEEKYRRIVELAPDGIVTLDLKGVITLCNATILRWTGYSKDEIVGNHFTKLRTLRMRDIPKYLKLFSSALEGKVLDPLEFTWHSRDGIPLRCEVNFSVTKKSGKPIGVQVIARDITERKKAELEDSRGHFQTLFNAMVDPVVIVDRKGKFLEITDKVEEITGFKREELIGKNFLRTKLVTAKSKAILIKNLAKRMMGMHIAPYEVEVLTKDGKKLPYEVNATKIEYKGKPADLVAFRDLSERKKLEQEIILKDEATASSMKAIVDARKRVASGVRARMVRVLISCLGFILVMPYIVVEIFEEGSIANFVIHLLEPVNAIYHFLIFLVIPAFLVIGYLYQRKEGLVDYLVEVVETKTEDLATTNEKLRVVGRLARHDVRNKLSRVTMNTFMAKQKLAGNQEGLKYLSEIESAVGQVEEIFEFARIYEKIGAEDLAYMDVERSLGEAVMLFSDLRNIKVVNDCRGLAVLADSLLRQLFYNLIDNSLRHGENVSEIRMYYEEMGNDKMKLVYEDDGVGIPKAEKEKIFKEGHGKGTGYGLYLIRKMCDVYGWTIRETGKQGKGAQFTITVPKMDREGKISHKIR